MFFKLPLLKQNKSKGIPTRKVIPVSFDNMERKKNNVPRINDDIDLTDVYLTMKIALRIKNKKHNISSRLLILLTTSVCIGCAT